MKAWIRRGWDHVSGELTGNESCELFAMLWEAVVDAIAKLLGGIVTMFDVYKMRIPVSCIYIIWRRIADCLTPFRLNNFTTAFKRSSDKRHVCVTGLFISPPPAEFLVSPSLRRPRRSLSHDPLFPLLHHHFSSYHISLHMPVAL